MDSIKIDKSAISDGSNGSVEIESPELAAEVSRDPAYVNKMVGHKIKSLKPEDVSVDSNGKVTIKNVDFARQTNTILKGLQNADLLNFGLICGGDHHFWC